MADIRPIRIMKRDKEEYQRLKRNMRAKQRRINNKFGITVDTIQTPNLSDFQSRSEFNKWKADVQNFNKRQNKELQFIKNENGVITNKATIKETKKNLIKVNSYVDSQMQSIDETIVRFGGKSIISRDTGNPLTFSERATAQQIKLESGLISFNDIPFSEFKTQKEYDKYTKQLKERSNLEFYDKRLEQMKTNYKKMLRKVFGEEADELMRKVEGMDSFQLYKMTLTQLDTTFEYLYKNEVNELSDLASGLLSTIDLFIDAEEQGATNANPIVQVQSGKLRNSKIKKYRK